MCLICVQAKPLVGMMHRSDCGFLLVDRSKVKEDEKIEVSHWIVVITPSSLKPLDTFGTETKLKVHRFTNNL